MMRRGAILVATALGLLVTPLAAWAAPTGSVTTIPIRQAPALGMPVLVLLAVALTVLTVYRLRRTGAGRIVGLGLVVAATVLAGFAYAIFPTITISGADCAKQTVSPFNPLDEETLLTSNCPNPIQIVDIQSICGDILVSPDVDAPIESAPNGVPECFIGQILDNGNPCSLLGCL